jgi:hypothetical protein
VSAGSRIEGIRQAQDEKTTVNILPQITRKSKYYLRHRSRLDLVFRVSVRRQVSQIGLFNCSNESTHSQLTASDNGALIGTETVQKWFWSAGYSADSPCPADDSPYAARLAVTAFS